MTISLADFKTEEELQSHLIASYQKAVAEGVLSSVCAQNMIMAIKRFLKIQDAKEKEVGKCIWVVTDLEIKVFIISGYFAFMLPEVFMHSCT